MGVVEKEILIGILLCLLNRSYQILTFFVNKIPGQNHVNFCCLTFFKSFLNEMDFTYSTWIGFQLVTKEIVKKKN